MDKSEERTQQRILDLANMADRRGIITYTDFMNLNELNIFHNKVEKVSCVRWKLFGGYAKAERSWQRLSLMLFIFVMIIKNNKKMTLLIFLLPACRYPR